MKRMIALAVTFGLGTACSTNANLDEEKLQGCPAPCPVDPVIQALGADGSFGKPVKLTSGEWKGLYQNIENHPMEYLNLENPGHCFKVMLPDSPPILILGVCHIVDPDKPSVKKFIDEFVDEIRLKYEKVYFEASVAYLRGMDLMGTTDFLDLGIFRKIKEIYHECHTIDSIDNLDNSCPSKYAVEKNVEGNFLDYERFSKDKSSRAEMFRRFWENGQRRFLWAHRYAWAQSTPLTMIQTDTTALAGDVRSDTRTDQWYMNKIGPDCIKTSTVIICGCAHVYGPEGLLQKYIDDGAQIEIMNKFWHDPETGDGKLLDAPAIKAWAPFLKEYAKKLLHDNETSELDFLQDLHDFMNLHKYQVADPVPVDQERLMRVFTQTHIHPIRLRALYALRQCIKSNDWITCPGEKRIRSRVFQLYFSKIQDAVSSDMPIL